MPAGRTTLTDENLEAEVSFGFEEPNAVFRNSLPMLLNSAKSLIFYDKKIDHIGVYRDINKL